jgi:hypothetical protein
MALTYSPRFAARIAGTLWLTCIVTGMLAFVGEFSLTARDDAARTAVNIMANEFLFRLTFVGHLLSGVTYLGLTALLYHLLKPVGRTVSFVAVAIGGVSLAAHIAPVVLPGRTSSEAAFTVTQLQAMALLAYWLRLQMFSMGMVFFGIQCILVGYLIARSTFVPRAGRAADARRDKLPDGVVREPAVARRYSASDAVVHAHRARGRGERNGLAAREGRQRPEMER